MPGYLVMVAVLLGVVAFALGRLRDGWFARRIAEEMRTQGPAQSERPSDQATSLHLMREDPVLLLEKLQHLRESGALTDAEFDAEKARILRG